MTEKDRIYYSNDEMMVELETFLENLKVLRFDAGYKALLGERFTTRLTDWDREIRQRRDDPFTIVVVGDFKRGKSMLINALLQEEVVPTNVTPETVTLNRISYGAHSNEAVLSNNRRLRLSDEELNRNELENVLSGLNERVERLELKRDNPLLKKVSIIDTPGLGDAMEDFSDLVKQSLIQADAVIYVFSAMYPLSKSEQIFLRSAVIPQKYTTLFLAANFTDILKDPDEYARVRETVEERAHMLLPDADVLMVSALDEVCRATGEERPNKDPEMTAILEEQFAMLRSRLDDLIEQKKDSAAVDRMQRLTTAMAADLGRELDIIEQGLNMSVQEAAQEREKFRKNKEESVALQSDLLKTIDAQIASFKKETTKWMGEFLSRIADETQTLASQPNEVLRKYYEVYCIDLLEKALTVCTELHTEELYDLLDGVSAQLSEKMAYAMPSDTKFGFRFKLDNKVWTKGDTASMALNLISIDGFIGTVASLAADGVAGMMREQESEKKKPDLLEKIASQMTSLSISVQDAVNKLYAGLGENAKKLVVEYYADQLEESEHALDTAVRAAAQEEEKKEELRAMLQNVRNLLKDSAFVQEIQSQDEGDE